MKKFKIFLVIIMTLITALAATACIKNPPALTSIAVKAGTAPAQIAQFTTPDFSDVVVVATYDDFSTKDITADKLTFSEVDTSALGEVTVTVSYEGKTTTFTAEIVLATRVIQSIAVKQGSYNPYVAQLSTPVFPDLIAVVTYENDAVVEYPASNDGFSLSQIDTDEEGEQTVTLSYTDEFNPTPLTATFNVEVVLATTVIKSIAVKANSYATEITQHLVYNKSTIIVILTYENNVTANIAYNHENLTIGEVDTSSAGQKTITVSYSDEDNTTPITTTFIVTVNVGSSLGGYWIDAYELPGFVNTYRSNISASTTGENAYFNKTEPYYVGNANKFVLVPKVTVVKGLDSKVLNSYQSDYAVSVWEGAGWVPLTGSELTSYVEIFPAESAFKFTAAAAGHDFRLTFSAREVDIYEDDEFDTLSFDVAVIDAYNVYNAAQLSVFDNFNNKGVWTSFKQDKGIDVSLNVNGIVLHNNIKITAADIPSSFIYQKDEAPQWAGLVDSDEGSLKSWSYIYIRKGDAGQTFNFIGNYFNVDASELPIGTEKSETATKPPISCSSLFSFMQNGTVAADITIRGGDNEGGVAGGPDGSVNYATNNVKNVTFIGNATRAPGEDAMIRMGGIIMIKSNAKMLYVYNTIMRRSFTDIYVVHGEANFKFESSKAYDSYSNSMLFWENAYAEDNPNYFSEKTMLILNSEIKRSGGPAIILNDYDTSDHTWANKCFIDIVNSTIESPVQGTEGWFAANNASAAMSGIKGLDNFFNANGKTYLSADGTTANFMILMMPGEPLTDTYDIDCWATIDGVRISNAADPRIAATKPSGAPIFETSAGGIGYSDGATNLFDITTGVPTAPVPSGSPLLEGSYITCYLKMGTYLSAVFTYSDYSV